MKKYGIFHPLWMAFYAKALYQDVAKNWTGIGLRYLLLLVVLCGIPTLYQMHYLFSMMFQKEVAPLVAQLPRMTFSQTGLTVDKPTPIAIKNVQGETVAMIDTSGKYTDLSKLNVPALLTRTQLFIRQNPTKTEIFQLQAILKNTGHTSWIVTPQEMFKTLSAMRYYLEIASMCVIFFLYFVYRLLQIFIYAAIGLFFAARLKVELRYATLLRLATIALTPPLLIGAFLERYFPIGGIPGALLFFGLSLGYLIYAIYANSPAKIARI